MSLPDPQFADFIQKVIPLWCAGKLAEHRAYAVLRPYLSDIVASVQEQMRGVHPLTLRERRNALLRDYYEKEVTAALELDEYVPYTRDTTWDGVLRDGAFLVDLGIAPYEGRKIFVDTGSDLAFDRRQNPQHYAKSTRLTTPRPDR